MEDLERRVVHVNVKFCHRMNTQVRYNSLCAIFEDPNIRGKFLASFSGKYNMQLKKVLTRDKTRARFLT